MPTTVESLTLRSEPCTYDPDQVSNTVGHTHLVANRLPTVWTDEIGWRPAPGGLVAALHDSLRGGELVDWIGSANSLGSPPGMSLPALDVGLRPVDVTAPLNAGAIVGMSNSVLWPALHGIDEMIRYESEYWSAYRGFNRAFSDAAIASCALGDRVWVHDYHLFLAPQMIKATRPDLRVGLSLHTPFDEPSMSRLPDSLAIADALSSCDVVGLQTEADSDQLRAFLSRHGRCEPKSVLVSPVSIDPERLPAAAADSAAAAQLRARIGARRLIIGVDRLDYTKGIVERLVAYDHVFRHHDLDPDDVHIVQIAQPSRTEVRAYQSLRVEVERIAHNLNRDWQRSDGTSPFEMHLEPVERGDVLTALASGDIAMVTPRRDGMNLVAKEFSILTEQDAGVLVLSTHAGAAAELGADAILVDGANSRSVADGLMRAIRLGTAERQQMAGRRARTVRSWTARDWSSAFIDQLDAAREPQQTMATAKAPDRVGAS